MNRTWVRVALVLLLVLGVGKALRDLSIEADKADDAGRPEASGALFDYRDTAYNPSRDLVHGDNPYDFVHYLQRHPGTQEFDPYTPSWFALVVPVALLPYHLGQIVWWCTLVAGIALLAALSLRAAEVRVDAFLVAGLSGALLLSMPGQIVMRSGQQAFLFASCLTVALLWGRPRPWLAAALLVVMASKPQFVIPVLVCLPLGLQLWKLVARWIALVAAVSLVPTVALMVAAGGITDLVSSVTDNLDYASRLQNDLGPSSPRVRIDALNPLGKLELARPTTAWQVATAVVLLTVAVLALRRINAGSVLQLVVVTTVTVACVPHYPYDVVLVLPALCVLVTGAREADRLSSPVRLALVALLTVPFLQTYQVDQVLERLRVSDGVRASIAGLCVLGAFVVAVATSFRPVRPRVEVHG